MSIGQIIRHNKRNKLIKIKHDISDHIIIIPIRELVSNKLLQILMMVFTEAFEEEDDLLVCVDIGFEYLGAPDSSELLRVSL
jgi:hypothetical protein